jgi:hypothetical protein
MHTIQIPGIGVNGKHPDDRVSFCCDVDLEFQVDGYFDRSSGGDDFNPALPQGFVSANSSYTCESPDFTDTVTWSFKASSDGSLTTGTIFVEEYADCK